MDQKFDLSEGAVLWFTGLSGAGKSTLARALSERLRQEGKRVEWIDGDEVRRLFPKTGFSRLEREAHIQRIAYTASLLEKHGVLVLVSLISPYESSRSFARELCQNFIEIFVSAPLPECERRDPKGLYRRAREGSIVQFTGVSDVYEVPRFPEIVLETAQQSVAECLGELRGALLTKLSISMGESPPCYPV